MADRFDKFTEQARRVLTLAQEEAQRFNHNYIGTEHLLLGLTREEDGLASRVLDNLGVQLPAVRRQVEFIIGRGESMIMGQIGLTPRSKKVIELAVDEARRLNHHSIDTEHLLLGLIREGEGIAAGVLESLGVGLEKVRVQVMQIVSSGSGSFRRDSGDPARPERPPEHLDPAPPSLGEALRGLQALRRELDAAISVQDFELASSLRERERQLLARIEGLERTWRGDRPEAPAAPPIPLVSPPATPTPVLRELLAVVPVAQTQERADVTVSLLSLERYANGFVANFRLLTGARQSPPPEFSLAASDDRGGRYEARLHGGTGGGGGDGYEWRFTYRFTPALDPAARRLELELAEGRWLMGTVAQAEEVRAGRTGPWTFTVALPTGEVGDAREQAAKG